MSFIYHIFGFIFYVIWSIIGALILVALVMLFLFKPWTALSGTGGVSDLLKSVQNQGGIKESYNNLPKATQDCLKNQMGEQGLNNLLAGKTQLSSATMVLVVKCLK